ncbi:Wzz/FepE/Etk N-terminal domain-containing protein [Paenibacillus dokdonensis]|uniref:Wzz/FepE/Etk N-terminal domain-containing protein n=1 Tax=Paenibacillus dokdonensis TaxID=2567944 RepID=A0ABU6GGV2_9BACL|nr:Wzz/FepE/Etk N-terminal domain-containing protein [Paenibacillus dokdonensis]MEC0238981.1 Wzz/FepE/Etk N-terminal domain-containing protein [Paenibacillus dokdonensis]
MELKLMIQMLRKRLWLIVAFVVICTAGAGLYSKYMITPMYEASSTLIVNKMNLDQEGARGLDLNEITSNIMLINSYKVIITSASIMDKVVQQHPDMQITSAELIDKLQVITAQNSQVITLKMRDPSYDRAMKIVNAVSQVFKEEIPRIMKVDNITLLDNAKPQKNPVPVSPKLKVNVALAFAASFLLVVGIVLLLEYLDDTVRNEYDVERYLELTTLGAIQKMKKRDLKTRSSARSKKQAGEKYAPLSQ